MILQQEARFTRIFDFTDTAKCHAQVIPTNFNYHFHNLFLMPVLSALMLALFASTSTAIYRLVRIIRDTPMAWPLRPPGNGAADNTVFGRFSRHASHQLSPRASRTACAFFTLSLASASGATLDRLAALIARFGTQRFGDKLTTLPLIISAISRHCMKRFRGTIMRIIHFQWVGRREIMKQRFVR